MEVLMTASKRAQILMEPEDYRRLEEIARQKNVSVAELIRSAVRERYLGGGAERRAGVESICSMNLPVIPWAEAEAEIAKAHGDVLP
jgi:predicted DNA-binding ribbon-helix-helix protein